MTAHLQRRPDLALLTAIERHLGDVALSRSPATVRTYRAALRHFAALVGGRVATAGALQDDDLVDFARWCGRESTGLAHVSRATYVSAATTFYRWLARERYLPGLDLRSLEGRLRALHRRGRKRAPQVPEDAVVAALVAAARRRPTEDDPRQEALRRRDLAFVECLRGSGMRVAELVGLRRRHLLAKVRGATVTGKGDKERTVYFTAEAWAALAAYFELRPAHPARSVGAEPVLLRHDHVAGDQALPLSTKSVRTIIRALGVEAGVTDAAVTPHSLRRWYATHVLEASGDLAAVQDLLGHESADTTRRYAVVGQKRLQAVHAHAFGEGMTTIIVNTPPTTDAAS